MTTVTLDLDDDVLAGLRAEAESTGRSLDQVVSWRLRRDATSIFDELRARPENTLPYEEGMALAVEEVRAMREERRAGR